MMQLRKLQQEMQRELLNEASSIRSAVIDAPPLPAQARLDIYRNAYRIRLVEALDDTYSVLHKLLGDEMFAALGEMFVAAHPSVHRSIRWYGSELADFMFRCPPFSEQPILSEVARFEWMLAEVFDAPDAAVLGRPALEAVAPQAWPDLAFRFHPSVRRMTLEWNTVNVWQAANGDQEPPQPEPAPQPVQWLLWRQDLKNYFRSLDAAEDSALDAALRGLSFADLCAAMADSLTEEEIPLRAATLIGTWADSGIIVGLELTAGPPHSKLP
jgi:hypothetical protein